MDELARLPEVAECYGQWNELRDELERYYKDAPREHKPFSQQKEFKAIKNMVIREAEELRLGVLTFEDASMRDEVDEDQAEVYYAWSSRWEMAAAYQNAKEILSEYENTEAEKAEQVQVLEKLWDAGFTVAAHLLGKCWRDGMGVLPDDEQAELWFRRAAEAGHDFSQYALGKLLQSQKRMDEAVSRYEKAAAQDNSYADCWLGKLYFEGKAVSKDVPGAVDHLTASAEQGNQFAQYALGRLLETQKRTEEAVAWYEKAAAQGNPAAAYRLGKLYLQGELVSKDVPKALEYLTVSARQGSPFAQYILGKLYLMGKDVEQDREKAYRWFEMATEQGNPYASSSWNTLGNPKAPTFC